MRMRRKKKDKEITVKSWRNKRIPRNLERKRRARKPDALEAVANPIP